MSEQHERGARSLDMASHGGQRYICTERFRADRYRPPTLGGLRARWVSGRDQMRRHSRRTISTASHHSGSASRSERARTYAAVDHVAMQRLERLVVHVREALRLARGGDDAHLRLALILLDSAAELMMHRECETVLSREWQRGHLLALRRQEERFGPLNEALTAERKRLVKEVTSEKRRERIAREFGAKADFLVDADLLPLAEARVLRKLHEYRNEAYHRDELRPTTLSTAVGIYAYLVCALMRDLPVHSMVMEWRSKPPQVIQDLVDPASDPLEWQPTIAAHFLREFGLDQSGAATSMLSEHLVDRIDNALDAVAYGVEHINGMHPGRGVDPEALLAQLQVKDVWLAAFGSPDELRAQDVPVRFADFAKWRERAEQIASETDVLVAFGSFADIEDAFESTEKELLTMAHGIDEAINDAVKEARGG